MPGTQSQMHTLAMPRVVHWHVEVNGLRIFYREAEAYDGAPTLLLLHGFPSGSHQFGTLMDALGGRFRLIAPDYPGFGHGDTPPSSTTGGSFARAFTALRPEDEGVGSKIRDVLTLSATRDQYLHGAGEPEAIAPDGWTLDHHFLELPGRKQMRLDLAFDYHSNVELYPQWQAWLREHQPRTLVVWGRGDPFFVEAGAEAFKDDVPDAEVHVFDAGHFALEDRVGEIAPLIGAFLERTWSPAGPVAPDESSRAGTMSPRSRSKG
jgi:pimeloyl-ACP methyl ester carboxylesterase